MFAPTPAAPIAQQASPKNGITFSDKGVMIGDKDFISKDESPQVFAALRDLSDFGFKISYSKDSQEYTVISPDGRSKVIPQQVRPVVEVILGAKELCRAVTFDGFDRQERDALKQKFDVEIGQRDLYAGMTDPLTIQVGRLELTAGASSGKSTPVLAVVAFKSRLPGISLPSVDATLQTVEKASGGKFIVTRLPLLSDGTVGASGGVVIKGKTVSAQTLSVKGGSPITVNPAANPALFELVEFLQDEKATIQLSQNRTGVELVVNDKNNKKIMSVSTSQSAVANEGDMRKWLTDQLAAAAVKASVITL